MVDVVVVGGGLSGLTAADVLHAAGLSVTVLEARPSVGGRLMTLEPDGPGPGAGGWFDLGATWHWADQPQVAALAAELGVTSFTQYREGQTLVEDPAGTPPRPVDVPPPSPTELRFVGGAQRLCRRLAERLPDGAVRLQARAAGVAQEGDGVVVTTSEAGGTSGELTASFVIVALPPRLASQDIDFDPPLPAELVEVLQATPTWMATALKCVAVYDRPFWRDAGWSGLAISPSGPLREVHDGCTNDASAAALWGFVSADHAYRDLGFEERVSAVFGHLGRLFGAEAADPAAYYERNWSEDASTNDEVVWLGAPAGFGHPLLGRPWLGGRLLWAGTETAGAGGGHMEGAVVAGRRAAGMVLHAG